MEGCPGRAATRTEMWVQFLHQNVLETVVILEEGNLPNNDPRLSHEGAVKRIGRYLLDTRDKGMIYRPDITRGLECYVDADFSGG